MEVVALPELVADPHLLPAGKPVRHVGHAIQVIAARLQLVSGRVETDAGAVLLARGLAGADQSVPSPNGVELRGKGAGLRRRTPEASLVHVPDAIGGVEAISIPMVSPLERGERPRAEKLCQTDSVVGPPLR